MPSRSNALYDNWSMRYVVGFSPVRFSKIHLVRFSNFFRVLLFPEGEKGGSAGGLTRFPGKGISSYNT